MTKTKHNAGMTGLERVQCFKCKFSSWAVRLFFIVEAFLLWRPGAIIFAVEAGRLFL